MGTDDDVYAAFVTAPIKDQLRMLREPQLSAALRARLGKDAFDQLNALAGADNGPVLGGDVTNLIVVPGIMGSVLVSEGLGGIWWIDVPRELKRLNGLALAPDGVTDLDQEAGLAAAALDAVYIAFRSALRYREDLGQIGYAYDWRKPIPMSADGLVAAIEDAHAHNGGKPVHLAAHSMGGLVVRTALMRRPALWTKIGKIAFMGTPHYGSPAIAGYLKHHFWGLNAFRLLGRYLSPETFRSMWGALSLLPAPAGIYPGTRTAGGDSDPTRHPCANFDLYAAEAYRLALPSDEQTRLQAVLDHAADLHRQLADWHQGLAQEQRERMLVIAGVGQKTLFRLAYKKPIFGFAWDRMDRVTARVAGDRNREGDGRVPLASAELEYVTTRYVSAEHGRLPTIPAVWGDVFAWFADGTLELKTTPQAALAADLGDDATSVTPALTSPRNAPVTVDDPGYLAFDDPSVEELDELDVRLKAGDLPGFERLRLL
jgi:pimeloyl-ACP methyl ester carboxylesterase